MQRFIGLFPHWFLGGGKKYHYEKLLLPPKEGVGGCGGWEGTATVKRFDRTTIIPSFKSPLIRVNLWGFFSSFSCSFGIGLLLLFALKKFCNLAKVTEQEAL